MRLGPVTLLCVVLAVPAAWAQPVNPRKEAGVHYQRGVAFYKEANYASALAEFNAAYKALPSFEVLYNIGLSERHLYKYGQALRTFNRYLQDGGEKVPKDRRASVAQEIDLIRSMTAPIAVIVNGPPANILVDGEVVATSPLSEMLLIAPGKHLVRAEREGDVPAEKPIEVVSGVSQAVTLELVSLKAPVEVKVTTSPAGAQVSADGAAPVTAPATLSLSPGTHSLRATLAGHAPSQVEIIVSPGQPRGANLSLAALASLTAPAAPRKFPVLGTTVSAGGLLLAGGGAWFALQAQASAKAMSDQTKLGVTWNAKLATLQADGQRNTLLAQGLLIGGATAFLTGLVLSGVSLLGAPDDDAPKTAIWFVPDLSGGGSVACAVRF